MKKSTIYTKTGDKGETSLVSGNRILKSDFRIELYGELDELNSRIGFAGACLHDDKKFVLHLSFIQKIQSAIFDLGSNLACEYENRQKYNLPKLKADFLKELETEIDKMDEELEPLKNFILPGGSVVSTSLHLCRTCTRNVERKLVHYQNLTHEEIPELSMEFLNRLSDYFFVLARYVNKQSNKTEVTWKPL